MKGAFSQAAECARAQAKRLLLRSHHKQAELLLMRVASLSQEKNALEHTTTSDLDLLIEIALAEKDFSGALAYLWEMLFRNTVKTNRENTSSDKTLLAVDHTSKEADRSDETLKYFRQLLEIYKRSNVQIESAARQYGLDVALCLDLNQPLYLAIIHELRSDNAQLLQLFLEDPATKDPFANIDYYNGCLGPVMVAVLSNCTKSLNILLKNRVDPRAFNAWRHAWSNVCVRGKPVEGFVEAKKILEYAAIFSSDKTVKLLLDHGPGNILDQVKDLRVMKIVNAIRNPETLEKLHPKGSTDFSTLLNSLETYAGLDNVPVLEVNSLLKIGTELVIGGANVIERHDAIGMTILHWAAALGNDESIIRTLFQQAPEMYHDLEIDPLLFAASRGSVVGVRVLLDQDLSFYPLQQYLKLLKDKELSSASVAGPLTAARSSVVAYWIEACFEAIECGHTLIVKVFLDRGLPVNSLHRQKTLLQCATRWSKLESVALLTSREANVNALHSGYTPLHIAICNGWEVGMNYLLEHGADMTINDKNWYNALTLAARWGQILAVKFLLDKGAEIDIPSRNGKTALGIAVAEKNLELLELLLSRYDSRSLEHASDVNALKTGIYEPKMRSIFEKWGYTTFHNISTLQHTQERLSGIHGTR